MQGLLGPEKILAIVIPIRCKIKIIALVSNNGGNGVDEGTGKFGDHACNVGVFCGILPKCLELNLVSVASHEDGRVFLIKDSTNSNTIDCYSCCYGRMRPLEFDRKSTKRQRLPQKDPPMSEPN